MSSTQAVAVVDLKKRAVQLASELSSRDQFWHAAHELLTFKSLSPSEFVRHSKKIVTLIEITRARLIESNIPLSKHVICTPGHEPYRSIYIQLLEALQSRQYLIEDNQLRARMKRLLLPLMSTSVASRSIRVMGVPIDDGLQAVPQTHLRTFHPYERQKGLTLRARDEIPGCDISMPPPDELPQASRKPKTSDRKIFDETITLDVLEDSPPKKEQWGEHPAAVPPRGRLRGRFGIFCTHKRR
ncbi:hypothetical protein NEOLEDRAFT_1180392 [Neolentinus lepideus HHB14362 ss-1]|uniref:Uncharacterized protein n=1 Tax=Neolentinus lepideus HHB14362 ss-1 TaxID=1314782 RepID=A0A165QWR7_9AGAM|nr:hypothetical protein NEOLEDRAFT_1180392 [Neolentinus lepideus HHB14362 ss-1]